MGWSGVPHRLALSELRERERLLAPQDLEIRRLATAFASERFALTTIRGSRAWQAVAAFWTLKARLRDRLKLNRAAGTRQMSSLDAHGNPRCAAVNRYGFPLTDRAQAQLR